MKQSFFSINLAVFFVLYFFLPTIHQELFHYLGLSTTLAGMDEYHRQNPVRRPPLGPSHLERPLRENTLYFFSIRVFHQILTNYKHKSKYRPTTDLITPSAYMRTTG